MPEKGSKFGNFSTNLVEFSTSKKVINWLGHSVPIKSSTSIWN